MPAFAQHGPQRKPTNEDGFLLLAAVVMVALVLIALAVAAPVVAREVRRDKELESKHREQQYVRAIRLYTKRGTGPYPASLEALEKSNNIRYLRKQYVDPLTGKADWRIIHVGENKTTVKGFFGEPLGGLNTSGGGLGSAGSLGTGFGGGSGSCAPAGGPVNGLAGGFSGAGSATGCATGGAQSGGTTTGSGTTGGGTTPGSGTTPSAGTTPTSGFGKGGVGPIMGVGSSRTGTSILTPNEQETYDSWEFLYDPKIELLYKKGQLGGGIGSQDATGFGKTPEDKSKTQPKGTTTPP